MKLSYHSCQRRRQPCIEIEKQLHCLLLPESIAPTSGNLDSTEIIGAFVIGGTDEVESKTVLYKAQRVHHQAVLKR